MSRQWVQERIENPLPCPKCGHTMGLEPTQNPNAFYDSCPSCGYLAVVTEETAPWKSRKGVIPFKALKAARECMAQLRK